MGEKKVVVTHYSWMWNYDTNGVMSKTEGRWVPMSKEVRKEYTSIKENDKDA